MSIHLFLFCFFFPIFNYFTDESWEISMCSQYHSFRHSCLAYPLLSLRGLPDTLYCVSMFQTLYVQLAHRTGINQSYMAYLKNTTFLSMVTLFCLQATETLFRMGVWRGYYSVIPRGEVYIFATSMATLLYLSRSHCNKSDSIYRVIR